MRRLALTAVLGVLLVTGAGVATADTTPGVLSSGEYQQLLTFQHLYSVKSLKSTTALNATLRRCRGVVPASGLVTAVRNNCEAGIAWLQASLKILSHVKACSKKPSVNARFGCLLPYYSRLSATIHTLYQADNHVDQVAIRRGFNKSCVQVLGHSQKAITAEGRMAKDAAKLVSAIRRHDVLGAQKWGGLYDADTADAESAGSHGTLSLCAHQ